MSFGFTINIYYNILQKYSITSNEFKLVQIKHYNFKICTYSLFKKSIIETAQNYSIIKQSFTKI